MKRRQGVSGTSLKVSSVFHPLLPSASSSWATGILPYRSALESTNSETDLSLSRKKAASTCNFMGWWKRSKQGWLDIKSPGQVATGWSFLCLSKQSLCILTEIDFIILEHLKAAWDCTEWFGDFSDTGEGSETFCWQVIACLVGIIRLVGLLVVLCCITTGSCACTCVSEQVFSLCCPHYKSSWRKKLCNSLIK